MVEILNPNIEILNKFENQIFKCPKQGLIGHYTGRACPEDFALLGGLRLSADKHGGILTYFRIKVKKFTIFHLQFTIFFKPVIS